MAENRLIALRGDTDVFTTFEGDNHVLTQLVAKELLTAYADDIRSMSPVEWVRFAASTVGERVLKRTAAEAIIQTIVDARQDSEEEGSLFNRGTQVKMFEDREEYLLASVARRLQGKSKEMSAFDAFNAVQDHVLHAASAHIDRVVLEAFVAGIDACQDDEARELLGIVCDLYALSVIEDDKAWYIEHRYLSTERAKAVTRGINDRCRAAAPARRDAGRRIRHPGAAALRRDAAPGESAGLSLWRGCERKPLYANATDAGSCPAPAACRLSRSGTSPCRCRWDSKADRCRPAIGTGP